MEFEKCVKGIFFKDEFGIRFKKVRENQND